MLFKYVPVPLHLKDQIFLQGFKNVVTLKQLLSVDVSNRTSLSPGVKGRKCKKLLKPREHLICCF